MVLLVVSGRILIWALSWTPLLDSVRKYEKVQYLLECDFCLGTWVYTILSFIMGVSLLPKKKFVGHAITGLILSFATHLMRIGWEERFGNAIHLQEKGR